MARKRFTAALLAILFLCCAFPAVSAEDENDNSILWSRETAISSDIRTVETIFFNGSRQAEHYISYRPGGTARPALAYGNSIREKLEFPAAAERAQGRVLAGINGDYFVMATGMPLGIVLHEGELISSDAGNAAFGFMEDGSAVLGSPGLSILLTSENVYCPVNSINKDYKSGSFSLYTSAWGERVPLDKEYRCIELRLEEGQKLTLGEELSCSVVSVGNPDTAVPMEEEKLILCYSGPDDVWQLSGLDHAEAGDVLTLSIRASDERFERCTEALGCLYPLMVDGAVLPGLDSIDKNKAPRTAIGIKEDGTILLYTADGRQSGYAVGLSLREVAERLLELGCVVAGALDGGASTVLACQLPGEDDCAVRNAPSLGRLRETPQFLLLTVPEGTSGELETVGVYCDEKVLLAGSSCGFRSGGCDVFGAPVQMSSLQWESDFGVIDGSGCFTAPDFACVSTIRASCGDVSGFLRIPVIDRPDEIRIYPEDDGREVKQLRVLPGSETELAVKAVWNTIQICASDDLFDWYVEGEIGVIDGSGHFIASEKAAAGQIVVSCGEVSCRLPVSVTDTVICAEDFEQPATGNAPGLEWSAELNRDRVKYGSGSLRLDYDLSEGSVTLPTDEYPTELGNHASLWVLSDGSGNNLYSVHDEISLLLGKLDREGWIQFTVDTETFGRIRALRIGGSGKGTLWLDQLLIFSTSDPDREAPVIRLDASDGALSAQIWDQSEGVLPLELLRLTVDGEDRTFEYDASGGLLSAELPPTDVSSHVMLTAYDRSGNYNSASILLEGTDEPVFSDMTGHWARKYVNYLSGLGVINGRPAEDGTAYFDPDSQITRAEFAVMLCRWLKLDLSAYGGELRFADDEAIPFWASDSVRAVAALGLIQGAAAADGLYFMPQQPLTRAQAAVILGRTMPGGRMMSDLPWPDAGDIPVWARAYVSELAFMGVMNGNGVTFEPNGPLTRAQAAKLLSELT